MRSLVFVLFCAAMGAEVADSELERWRAWYTEGLRTDGGVLTYTGLFWLKPGENLIGSDAACGIRLPLKRAPRRLGAIDYREGRLYLRVFRPYTVSLNGKPFFRTADLITDEQGTPDVIGWAPDLSLFAVRRGGRMAVVLSDRQSQQRRDFAGSRWHPADPAWKLPARWISEREPRTIELKTRSGNLRQFASPGLVEFAVNGKSLRLAPVQIRNSLYFYFRDTAGGKIRVLHTDVPSGEFFLDFNRAYYAACEHSPYADCALPPEENNLDVPVPAGENLDTGSGRR